MKEKEDFGDFEEIKDEKSESVPEENSYRVRLPRGKELIGIIIQRLGGNRMEIKTTDGKTRNCRVPGRYRKNLWLRPKNIVLITPWDLDDKKGDVIYKYNPSGVIQLRKLKLIDNLTDEF